MARNKFDIDEQLDSFSEFNVTHLKRMTKYVLPYKKEMGFTLIMMMASSLLGLTSPYIFKVAIDNALPPNNRNIPLLVLLAGIVLVINIANIFAMRLRIKNMSVVGQGVIRDLRLDLFRHLQRLPFAYYDSRPHGKILVRIVNNINSLSDMFSNGIINAVIDLASLVFIVVIMLSLDVKLTLISMAGLPVLLLVTKLIKDKQHVAWRSNSTKNSNMNAYIHESIAGMKVTQGFVREGFNRGIFEDVTTLVYKTWMKACSIMFLMWPAAENISVLTTSFLYVVGVNMILGNTGVTVGLIVAFSGYVWRFWGPINNLANFYNTIVVNMTYMERIFEALDEPVPVDDISGATEMPDITGNVAFEDVVFSYDPGTPILKDISFSCNAGDSIALVGPTGAGKTTVVNLISRFYNLDSGRILIDGTDIHTVTLRSLRSRMGIMLQDSFIFSGTIMENIRYGRLEATDDEIIEAAKAVHAHGFIIEMEKGYQTEVNERGSRLSVGQRQLISFARVLLADPRILVLDEATSSIDTKTEKIVQQGLERLLVGRTSFIIAHRLSTIKNATTIMYIDGGTILEAGNHTELLQKKGAYYELFKSQYSFLEE